MKPSPPTLPRPPSALPRPSTFTDRNENVADHDGVVVTMHSDLILSGTLKEFDAKDSGQVLYGMQFGRLSDSAAFAILASMIFVLFGIHNIIQEGLTRPGGSLQGLGAVAGLIEIAGVTLCAGCERAMSGQASTRTASLYAYISLTAVLWCTTFFSTQSLNYINYPTKVVVRSCKLIPTMVVGIFINRRSFTFLEYFSAFLVCAGLVMFTLGDMATPTFHPIGLVLAALSVVADAFLPNIQERLIGQGSSRLEVVYYSNLYAFFLMLVPVLGAGELRAAASIAISDFRVFLTLFVFMFLAYFAIMTQTAMVERFGSVPATLTGNIRKALTVVLSFLLYPKPFLSAYLVGGLLVLAGVLGTVYAKESHSPYRKVHRDEKNLN
eukprot:gnl/Spiro4/14078_TR7558_c0_g1_i1.p1 gnl/Spiro4/14078_TR7558_c0_g1~~gnl/Spiro4/14078_TR7558_c0_g1_i1.p1  ORF type:complete len:413 (+),score=96.70 gnl/Spiro4/14078_TR7558_c0_g1_i1:98-1240(+)